MIQILFYILSGIAIASALLLVFSKNPVYSVLSLIVTFFSIAGHYVLLNAQFLAAVHVIVYAGAIMVLFLYVIMLLNLNKESEFHRSVVQKSGATIVGCLLLILLIGSIKKLTIENTHNDENPIGLVKNLGNVLFTDFVLPFEICSILLLAAMIGAVLLTKTDKKHI